MFQNIIKSQNAKNLIYFLLLSLEWKMSKVKTEWVNLTPSGAAGPVSSARQSPATADQWTPAQGPWLQDVRWNGGDVEDYWTWS